MAARHIMILKGSNMIDYDEETVISFLHRHRAITPTCSPATP